MIVNVVCFECEGEFGVDNMHIKATDDHAKVRLAFNCPYCLNRYVKDNVLDLVGMSGGVNIGGGSKISVGGDIVGGNLIRK